MLVLTRRKGEAICIGDNVIVRITQVSGGKIRLAIQAPESVLVDREEVRQRRQEFALTTVEFDKIPTESWY